MKNHNMKHLDNSETRTINPKLGYLGILGLLGFLGIWSYGINKTIFPFIFFSFFGFFGFFFEGKMSNTFIDERFLDNKRNADLNSYHIGVGLSFVTLIASSWGWLWPTNEAVLIFFTVSLSLISALVVFLKEYLLYKYDHNENNEE